MSYLSRWANSYHGRRRGHDKDSWWNQGRHRQGRRREPTASRTYNGHPSNPFPQVQSSKPSSTSSRTSSRQQPAPAPNPRWANLENNQPLPQGWQRPYAQPTSISSLITGLLYQSRQDPMDVWNNFFGNKRSSNPTYSGGTTGKNPWGYDKGASSGSTGASQGNLSQAAMQSLQLADAYFSPKRLELAYELGDMETDMRRLSVNLGRQVDDPILQAKLYKEAMRSIRTLDSEQNSFAIQMVEQRRKEELQNSQFYDQLALEERKTTMQDDQFYSNLSLQRDQAEDQNKQFYANLSVQQQQVRNQNNQFYAQLNKGTGTTSSSGYGYTTGW